MIFEKKEKRKMGLLNLHAATHAKLEVLPIVDVKIINRNTEKEIDAIPKNAEDYTLVQFLLYLTGKDGEVITHEIPPHEVEIFREHYENAREDKKNRITKTRYFARNVHGKLR